MNTDILANKILNILKASPEPLKAKDIQWRLLIQFFLVGRKSISQLLYSDKLKDKVSVDSEYRWSIKKENLSIKAPVEANQQFDSKSTHKLVTEQKPVAQSMPIVSLKKPKKHQFHLDEKVTFKATGETYTVEHLSGNGEYRICPAVNGKKQKIVTDADLEPYKRPLGECVNIDRDNEIYFVNYYYPKRASEEQNEWSRAILQFKDGDERKFSYFSQVVRNFTRHYTSELKTLGFVTTAPASGQVNSEHRPLCNLARVLAKELGVPESQDVLIRTTPLIKPSHLQQPWNRPTGEDQYQSITVSDLHGPKVRGKRVLLFDDIYTQGKTFDACRRRLFEAGASGVTGLILGRTRSF